MSLSLTDIDVTVPDGPETRTILRSVSLDVAAGEAVAITGASGSGKSTLLAIAALLKHPTSGTVTVAGTATDGLSRQRLTMLRRDHVGIVFQDARLFPALNALEQVEFVAHAAGRLDRAARERARSLLVEVGLEDRLHARPSVLSGGERQRVAIARALMNEPEVLLADEPTAALDDARGRAVTDLLVHEAASRGIAAVIVTHNPAQLPASTRRLHLADGALTPAGREAAAPA